ncbi:MAG: carbohydrate ABC transporter permease [Candidatus Limnocylindria bacterium]
MTTPPFPALVAAARGLAGFGVRYGLLLIVVLISLAPFLWVVISSFKTNVEVLGSALSLPATPNLDGYVSALTRTRFPLFLLNSVIASAGATLLAVGVFGMAAYALARYQFRGARLIYALLISTLLISLIPMQQPITLVIRNLGLYDTRWALILVYAAKGLPIAIFILHSYFKTIPRDLEEAAALDGASAWQIYVRVALPLARPAIAAASVLIFLNAWNDFLFPLLLTQSEETRTLSYALRFFLNAYAQDYPTLLAAVVLTLIPSVIVYVVLQEQIQKSLVGGAVRG